MMNDFFELPLLSQLTIAWTIVGVAVALLLQYVVAPFGRHASDSWGWSINNRVGWVTFELL
jgi:3-oxo-5-alpha-steroid 4-dehydrogenase 1